MKKWVRIALAAGAAVVATVVVVSLGGHAPRAEADLKLPVGRIAHRVEDLRGLKFRYVPKVEVVAQKDLADKLRAGRGQSKGGAATAHVENQAMAAQVLSVLSGLVPPKLAKQMQDDSGGDVAGVYDPHSKHLFLVKEAVEQDRRTAEMVLAHELTHALEDQHFHDFMTGGRPFADTATAKLAVIEGGATLVELRYAQRYLHARGDLDALLTKRARGFLRAKLPPQLQEAEAFPYVDGGRFIAALHNHGGWPL